MASAVTWVVLMGLLITLFFAVLIPTLQFSGRGEIPADFPVYPGARLQGAFATTTGACMSVSANWSTPDDATQVVAFYQEQLGAGDWTVVDTRTSGSATVIYFRSTSGPDREGYLSIEAAPFSNGTQITMDLEKSRGAASCRLVVGTTG
ncbi:MAG TPA: hypothetical protein VKT20_02350 [Candidatus Dormibacteraeota bacterium]|nr:hypothetical protein [Candidatus Dormibacteraeota bacterium]